MGNTPHNQPQARRQVSQGAPSHWSLGLLPAKLASTNVGLPGRPLFPLLTDLHSFLVPNHKIIGKLLQICCLIVFLSVRAARQFS